MLGKVKLYRIVVESGHWSSLLVLGLGKFAVLSS